VVNAFVGTIRSPLSETIRAFNPSEEDARWYIVKRLRTMPLSEIESIVRDRVRPANGDEDTSTADAAYSLQSEVTAKLNSLVADLQRDDQALSTAYSEHLRGLGLNLDPEGLAKHFAESTSEEKSLWWFDGDLLGHKPRVPRVIRHFVEVLWSSVVKSRVNAYAGKISSVVRPVIDRALLPLHRRRRNRQQEELPFIEFDTSGVPSVSESTLRDLLERRYADSLAAYRLLGWEVREGFRIATLNPHITAVRLDMPGGYRALAEHLKLSSKDATALRQVVMLQAHSRFIFPDGRSGNLLSYTETTAAPGRRAHLSITLGDQLLPRYVHGMSRENRQLVPWPDTEPTLEQFNPRDRGRMVGLYIATLSCFRGDAAELVTHGGALLNWGRLAKIAGVSAHLAERAAHVWSETGDLAKHDRDRWTVGPRQRGALEFLLQGGQKSLLGSQAGKLGAAKLQEAKRKLLRPKK